MEQQKLPHGRLNLSSKNRRDRRNKRKKKGNYMFTLCRKSEQMKNLIPNPQVTFKVEKKYTHNLNRKKIIEKAQFYEQNIEKSDLTDVDKVPHK